MSPEPQSPGEELPASKGASGNKLKSHQAIESTVISSLTDVVELVTMDRGWYVFCQQGEKSITCCKNV